MSGPVKDWNVPVSLRSPVGKSESCGAEHYLDRASLREGVRRASEKRKGVRENFMHNDSRTGRTSHLAVNAVLRVDDELLADRVRLGIAFRIDILVHRSGAHAPEQARILFDVGLDVLGALRSVDVQVDGLVFGVVGARARDRSQDIK